MSVSVENQRKSDYYKYCFVPNCRNTTKSTPNKIFIRVPDNDKVRQKWIKAVRSKDSAKTKRYCCEDHFDLKEDMENYMYFKEMGGRMIMKKDVLPRFFVCQPQRTAAQPTKIRNVVAKRQHMQAIENILIPEPFEDCATSPSELLPQTSSSTSEMIDEALAVSKSLKISKAIQVKIKPHFRSVGNNYCFKKEVRHASTSPIKFESESMPPPQHKSAKLDLLRQRLFSNVMTTSSESMRSTDSVKPEMISSTDSDEKRVMKKSVYEKTEFLIKQDPMFYLGLPNDYFHLVDFLTSKLNISEKHILIIMRKIKRNEPYKMLGYEFELSISEISKILNKTIPLVASCMKKFIFWPQKIDIMRNLLIQFRARYGNVQSIIDCFEIQIEKPTDPVIQALTWSEYKKCNTLKYLISATPDGIINFLSVGYGGRVLDNILVEDCGYLDALPESTCILADRGFKHLESLLQQKNCTLARPPSVESQRQPTKEEVLLTKRIASVRIHIERVIRRIREFESLIPHACIDNHLIKFTDDIVLIAGGLVNLQGPLIK